MTPKGVWLTNLPHLVNPFRNETLAGSIARLRIAHDYLVTAMQRNAPREHSVASWGVDTKRHGVQLSGQDKPADIGKDREALAEVVNMLATIERLLAALCWFQATPEYHDALVMECHPTTSDSPTSNDLVLATSGGDVVAVVEVCDVAGTSGDSNAKEPATLRKLACDVEVPVDGPARFMATSPEFARHLQRRRRNRAHYRFEAFEAHDSSGTILLRLWPDAYPSLQRR